MNLTDILAQAGGLQSVARDLGISEEQAASGAEALLPAIMGGMKKQAQAQPAGLAGLGGLLGQLGGGGLFDQVLSPQPTDPSQGNAVLGQIFGSKDVSRTVADNAASQSGLDSGLLRKMLPLLAMLVTGYMAKQAGGAGQAPEGSGSGGLGGLVGSLGGLFGGGGAGTPGAGGAMGALGGLGAMLDANGDGNALDDILRMAGKTSR
ncbi:DUF937 domain-containing protein [Ramlibacter sp. AW1]|uniref:DUF937 domain-containing protein n=1 Tax=Ramlibacter aurantiacus TaxID=2801330 RepID=A0A936ZJG7_9BURK|nr:DUF937 domain-containing protein [Ramlibacter aurantiacus]MBL0422499.1 DUF937 domain-containing protein [Ramlibacter aurantiacus]